jgi:hypothetical protein
MKYKYRSTCRFSMLLDVDGDLIQIRPNQIIESTSELNYEYLKRIEEKPKRTPAKRKPRRKLSGKNSLPKSDGVRK